VRWSIPAAAAIVIATRIAAQAADLGAPIYAPPTAVRTVAEWGGFYLGGNADVIAARTQDSFSAGGTPFAASDTAVWGGGGGVQGGFNWQAGSFVIGAEGDFQWTSAKGSISAQCAACGPATASLDHDIDWFGTARARVGYAAGGWLAYVTGGYAFGRVVLNGTATSAIGSASFTQNATPSGWTIGAGTEVAINERWSAKLEYLYVDLGTVNNTVVIGGIPTVTDSARVQMNVVRAGVNYRF
jgi:outer membrane immunogenic protein